jgi:hypothetical protein
MIVTLVPLLLVTAAPPEAQESWLAELTPAALEKHAREIVRHVRPSGSPGELAAIDYIAATLRTGGVPVTVHEFQAYVSDPVSASFRIESPQARDFPALTQAFSASTGASGVSGEIVDVGRGAPSDYAGASVRGKLVLADGLADPEGVQAAQNAGAIGAVFAATADRVNEMTVGPIWGTPSTDDARLLPRIGSVAVGREAGVEIRRMLRSGPVRVRIQTDLAAGFKTLRLVVATITSPRDPEGFVLLGGHIDAWHHGGTDEGASNAAMLEMALVLHRHRDTLARGLKVAWWPGHSNGRYAGSTWYADRFWTELRDGALAYLNIDGVGQKEASRFTVSATAELEPLAREVVEAQAGTAPEVSRPGRNSDQSFNGIGLPLLQFNRVRTEGIGGYWWWHTPEDTFDKIDFEILAGDTKLYLAALQRLLAEPVPPIRLSEATAELESILAARASAAEGHPIDLGPALERASRLHRLAVRIDEALPRAADGIEAGELARRLVRTLRPVIRVLYEERGPYHQDLALEHPLLPGLASTETLSSLASDPTGLGFAVARLQRESNRLVDHLDQALGEAEALEKDLERPQSPKGERP